MLDNVKTDEITRVMKKWKLVRDILALIFTIIFDVAFLGVVIFIPATIGTKIFGILVFLDVIVCEILCFVSDRKK